MLAKAHSGNPMTSRKRQEEEMPTSAHIGTWALFALAVGYKGS